jgi:hypothetical protein
VLKINNSPLYEQYKKNCNVRSNPSSYYAHKCFQFIYEGPRNKTKLLIILLFLQFFYNVCLILELFNPIIKAWLINEKLNDSWTTEEDLYLIESCVNESCNISNLQMPNRTLLSMIILLTVLKEKNGTIYVFLLQMPRSQKRKKCQEACLNKDENK